MSDNTVVNNKNRRNISAVEKKLFQLIQKEVDDDGITTKGRDVISVKRLLKQRLSPRTFDINCCNENGYTPLMIVASEIDVNVSLSLTNAEERRSYEVMKLLLDHGADVNKKNTIEKEDSFSLGMTALHYACFGSSSKILQLLLRYGANPNLSNEDGTTPLLLTTCLADTNKMKILLDCDGVDVNVKDDNGYSPIHALIHIGCVRVHINDVIRAYKLLVQYGANVNVPDIYGVTPLFHAVNNSRQSCSDEADAELKLIQLLLDADADCVNIQILIPSEDPDFFEEYGQEIICNSVGDTSFHNAVRIGKVKVIQLLLSCHPNLTIRNSDNETAFDIAKRLQFLEIMEMIEVESRQQIYKYLLHSWTTTRNYIQTSCLSNQIETSSTSSTTILKRKFFST